MTSRLERFYEGSASQGAGPSVHKRPTPRTPPRPSMPGPASEQTVRVDVGVGGDGPQSTTVSDSQTEKTGGIQSHSRVRRETLGEAVGVTESLPNCCVGRKSAKARQVPEACQSRLVGKGDRCICCRTARMQSQSRPIFMGERCEKSSGQAQQRRVNY